MSHLRIADFTRRPVTSSLMLHKNGGVGPGSYVRRAKNVISSPGLLRRMSQVSGDMQQCALADACTRDPAKVGTMNSKGKPFRMCSVDECAARLKEANACASRVLSA